MHNRIWGYLRFYKSFAAVSLSTTAVSILYYFIIKEGPIPAIVSIKLATGVTVYFFTTRIRTEKLVFYYNLHYRPIWLWTLAFMMDATILTLLLIVSTLFR